MAKRIRGAPFVAFVVLVVCMAAALVAVAPGQADAADDLIYNPYGTWNGEKIYLSPSSQNTTTCNGVTEATMAYRVASAAATGVYYWDVYQPSSSGRNLRARGYKARISRGTVSQAIWRSNDWGSSLHIPIHSNGDYWGACGRTDGADFGTLVIFWSWGSSKGEGLADKLALWVGAVQAGGAKSPGYGFDRECHNSDGPCYNPSTYPLGELVDVVAYAGYIEAEYHTWTIGANWQNTGYKWGWRIGVGVDQFLGYP